MNSKEKLELPENDRVDQVGRSSSFEGKDEILVLEALIYHIVKQGIKPIG